MEQSANYKTSPQVVLPQPQEVDKVSITIQIYHQLIADSTFLQGCFLLAHLNNRGSVFYQDHLLFERCGNALAEILSVDAIAESIGGLDCDCPIQVGCVFAANNSQFSKKYKPFPLASMEGAEFATWLLEATLVLKDYCCKAGNYLSEIGCACDANQLQEYEKQLRDKIIYLLSSTLHKMGM
jgi:hypothetical protein